MKSQEPDSSIRQVFAEIVLGSPRARCARFGICEARLLDFEAWKNYRPKSARAAKAIITTSPPCCLKLTFPAQAMQPLTFEYFFGTGFFRVDVPTRLSPALLKALNLKDFVVKKGHYPCNVESSAAVTVTLRHSLDSNRERDLPVGMSEQG